MVFAALDGPTFTKLRQVAPEPDDGLASEVSTLEERRRDLANAYAPDWLDATPPPACWRLPPLESTGLDKER